MARKATSHIQLNTEVEINCWLKDFHQVNINWQSHLKNSRLSLHGNSVVLTQMKYLIADFLMHPGRHTIYIYSFQLRYCTRNIFKIFPSLAINRFFRSTTRESHLLSLRVLVLFCSIPSVDSICEPQPWSPSAKCLCALNYISISRQIQSNQLKI